jgi:transcriptional regulator with XRE-family HTH domain
MKNNLRTIRKSKNLTQYELADLTGIGRVNITRYELGTSNVPMKNAIKIADALDCTLDDLFGESEKEVAK